MEYFEGKHHNECQSRHIGFKKGNTPRKLRVTPEMLQVMDERRKWKRVNSEYGRRKLAEERN